MPNMNDHIKSLCPFFLTVLMLLFVSPASGLDKKSSHAKNGMVVSTSELASIVGRDVLARGGNAIDASVATAFALAVTWPSAGNIGGGGFLIYHSAKGKVTAIDFREKAPLAATEKMFLASDGTISDNSNHEGLLSVGVPGTVAGLFKAHTHYGNLPWAQLLEPAVQLASKGIKTTEGIYRSITSATTSQRLRRDPAATRKFFQDGNLPYRPGDLWRQPDLAATLKRIQQHGHDGFYRGETAQQLATTMKKEGGLITTEDLARYEAVERTPIHGTYRGYDLFAMPPPSSGGIALVEMLNMLEAFDLRKMKHNSPPYLHLLTETMRRAFADRAKHLGDPDFNPKMPVERLISKSHAALLRQTIDLKKSSKSDPETFSQPHESEETTHICVVDGDGNAVSLTTTLENAFGSAIVAQGLGFLLNNEMGDFNPIPGHTDRTGLIGTPPNRVAPQKRMLSSMTPTIVAKNGKPVLVIGSPGGRTIINTVLQVIVNHIDFDMDIAEAIDAARIHHQWLPDVTRFESGSISEAVQSQYRAMGHAIQFRSQQGRAMGITIDHQSGLLSGASDRRSVDGAAVGY